MVPRSKHIVIVFVIIALLLVGVVVYKTLIQKDVSLVIKDTAALFVFDAPAYTLAASPSARTNTFREKVLAKIGQRESLEEASPVTEEVLPSPEVIAEPTGTEIEEVVMGDVVSSPDTFDWGIWEGILPELTQKRTDYTTWGLLVENAMHNAQEGKNVVNAIVVSDAGTTSPLLTLKTEAESCFDTYLSAGGLIHSELLLSPKGALVQRYDAVIEQINNKTGETEIAPLYGELSTLYTGDTTRMSAYVARSSSCDHYLQTLTALTE